ncbi:MULTISPECIES: hypothetical protein [unclassified Streptosporangium]|uniref:hypothetical protein n=1 Tax=unclassified Streptosporangium TaxID=2632669 RepID=UPI002E2909FC|nr:MULTISPECIES: hypothetical protein [unclassified Streptosporangium]
MTVNEQKITEELRLMAGEARPVDALAYASRAAAGASRRRRLSWSLAGLAVAAASVAGVFVVGSSSGFPEGRNIAAKVAGLPRNTPEQLRAVRECMPTGGPVHNMDGNRRIPEHGRAEDFRVLVEYRDRGGSTALVGSTAGFVLCTPTTQKEFAGRAVFTYWGYNPPGDLTGFSGDLNVDAYEGQTHSYAVGPEREQRDDNYLVVVGRVTPDVRRVEIDWAGRRRVDAQVANGFFIGRMLTKPVPDPGGRVDANGEPLEVVDTPLATVTAYDEAGRVVGQEKGVNYMWRGPAHRPTPGD